MALKRAIIYICPDAQTQAMAATMCGAYLKNFAGYKFLNTSFSEIFNNSICRMFGLATSAAYYHDKMDDQLPDFHGFTPRQTFAFVLEKLKEQYPNVLGRAIMRIIKREDLYRVFLFHETPTEDTIRGLIEGVGGAENICMVFIDCAYEDLNYPPNTTFLLQKTMKKKFSMQDEDREHLRFMVRGLAKLFLGITEDA